MYEKEVFSKLNCKINTYLILLMYVDKINYSFDNLILGRMDGREDRKRFEMQIGTNGPGNTAAFFVSLNQQVQGGLSVALKASQGTTRQ